MRSSAARLAILAVTALTLLPADLAAQRCRGRDCHDDRNRGRQRRESRAPRRPFVTFEAFVGGADFGRFLEQTVGPGGPLGNALDVAFQRELSAERSLAFGGSLGFWIMDKTNLRVGFTHSTSEMEFRDDDPAVELSGPLRPLRLVLTPKGVADLSTNVISLEIMRFALDPRRTIAPYAAGGVTATFWNLSDLDRSALGRPQLGATDEAQLRFGGAGAIGLQLRATNAVALRAEVNTLALGNPFDGEEGYHVELGAVPFDEPSTVRVTRFTLGLTYTIGR